MSDVKFDLKPVEEKPRRKYRTGSKYDAVLDAFMKGAAELVEVSVEGKEANYLRLQLSKRIDAREIGGVKASVLNGVVYLEKE
ncbi:unnamed protein product [marine sediment metagenome]|uniref:Uncharacterized protein n=1 Tax=marine sediment metagenome TaxID=412755 RepID=X0TWW4_9ZZZZ